MMGAASALYGQIGTIEREASATRFRRTRRTPGRWQIGNIVQEASATVASGTSRVPVYTLLIATAISLLGTRLTGVAVPWFVLVTTGSAAKTGLTVFFTTLPLFLSGFFGGALVDRLGFKRTSVLADLFSGATIALIPLLYYTVGLAFWQLLLLVFLADSLNTPGNTARQGLWPDLTELAGYRLERVNAARQGIGNLAGLLGPPLAGALIAVVGPGRVLWLDAATFLASAVAVAVAVPATRRAPARAGRYLAELLEGWRFIRRDRLIFALFTFDSISNFLGYPIFFVVLPVYASRVLGSSVALGVLLAGFGGGSLAGALLYGAVGHRLPRRATFIWSFLLSSLPFFALAITPPLGVAVAAMVAIGLTYAPFTPLLTTVAQERTPAALRGRVFGMLTAVSFAASTPGVILVGYLLDVVSLRAMLLAFAVANLPVALAMALNPALRAMNPPSAAEREAHPGGAASGHNAARSAGIEAPDDG
jgi:MFS family permease